MPKRKRLIPKPPTLKSLARKQTNKVKRAVLPKPVRRTRRGPYGWEDSSGGCGE